MNFVSKHFVILVTALVVVLSAAAGLSFRYDPPSPATAQESAPSMQPTAQPQYPGGYVLEGSTTQGGGFPCWTDCWLDDTYTVWDSETAMQADLAYLASLINNVEGNSIRVDCDHPNVLCDDEGA